MRLIVLVLTVLLSSPVVAQDEITPLDQAIIDGMRDESLRPAFYDLFLETPLYVPVVRGSASPDGDMMQVMIMSSEFQGVPLFNVFDREDRLDAFMARRNLTDYDFVLIDGSAVISMAARPFFVFLNPETPHEFFIEPVTVDWLANDRPNAELLSQQVLNLRYRPVEDEIAEQYLPMIRPALERDEGILEARIVRRDSEPPSLMMFVRVTGMPDDARRSEIYRAIGATLAGMEFPDGGYFDIVILTGADWRQVSFPAGDPHYLR